MKDFFYGFVRNYHSFRIEPDANWTRWTNRILGFYDQLGAMLGARSEYEWNKYDLSWFRRGDDKTPWLHVEHENKGSWAALDDTIRKISESVCEDIIAIVYPNTKELWERFLKKLEKSSNSWTDETEVLAILDASFFETGLITMEGHVVSKKMETEVFKATKKTEETDHYYAFLR